ncbi:MAG: hypothetical protein PHC33_00040 [Candidatus Omnitrophica bacterium]|nr:hypothetical protein [Candidatus Omnitrophota bacterium]
MFVRMVFGTLIFTSFLGCSFFPAQAAGDQPEFYGEIGRPITVSGEIARVKMTNFANNPWMETVLTTAQGEKYVLIGKPVEELNALKGKSIVTVNGVLKPKMSVKGELIKVINLQKIIKTEAVAATEETKPAESVIPDKKEGEK